MDSDDKKITQLARVTSLSDSDLLVVVVDIGTAPVTKAIEKSNAITASSGGGGLKYIINPFISSSDLVLSIKYIDGNDCTPTNKVTFRVYNTEYDLTAAMSFTKADGTNWMNCGSAATAAKNVQFFVYAIGETGASAGLKFGYSRIPYAKTMGDFVNTTTSERYIAGNWTNFNATDHVTNIGRFQAQLSAGAGYTWTIPTPQIINYPIYTTDRLTFSPIWTNLTVGNGTQTAYYVVSYDITVTINILFGSTTAISGDPTHTHIIPPIFTLTGGALVVGLARLFDTGVGAYAGLGMVDLTTAYIRAQNAAGTYLIQATPSSTVPFTWVTNDEIQLNYSYMLQ